MTALVRYVIDLIRTTKPALPRAESVFLQKQYQMHNVARLRHLESLALPIAGKSVLEFGAGIGDHTFFYLTKGCRVVSTDVRRELLEVLTSRFDVTALVINAETDRQKIQALDKVDIVHCYGLLYHIQTPMEFLQSLGSKCDLLLLETCVSHDLREDGEYIVRENSQDPTQAISGLGCRPTRRWVYNVLRGSFRHVYFPRTQPAHPEFPVNWGIELEDRSKLIRAVFIASQTDLGDNCYLTSSAPLKYGSV
jgi:Methyltransferase domain